MFNYASKSDTGKVRENNEDHHIVVLYDEENEFAAAIADGMGGHLFGEIASKAAIDTFEKKIRDRKFKNCTNIKEYLLHISQVANREILQFSKKHKVVSGMGTTLVAVYIKDDTLYISHIGDSRTYLVDDKGLNLLTKDHSLVQELLDKGDITISEYKAHPKKNVITKALGIREEPEPDIFQVPFESANYILLCSDGLTNMLDDNEIFNIINQETDLERKVKDLTDAANEKGGTDNITVIIIQPTDKTEAEK